MNRILLSICALMLSASAANAQYLTPKGQVVERFAVTANASDIQLGRIAPSARVNAKTLAPQKINENQMVVGNDGASTMTTAIGLPTVASAVKGVYQEQDVALLKKFKGAKIVGVRYLLGASLGATAKVQLYTIATNGTPTLYTEVAASSQEISTYDEKTKSFDQKWNEVTFEKPLNVDDINYGLLLGYSYKQKATSSGTTADGKPKYTAECFPIALNDEGSSRLFAYGNLGQGTAYYNIGTGVICIQFIIEKAGGFADDLGLVSISTSPMVTPDGKLPLIYGVKNYGNKACKAAEFDLVIDDQVVATLTPESPSFTSETSYPQVNLDLKEYNVQNGTHSIGVRVKTVNGEAPSGNTDDDEAYTFFRVYSQTTPRQYNLVEQFTSNSCPNCPAGYDFLRALQKHRDDIAWVSIHSTYNEELATDPYETKAGGFITNYSVSGFPSANFNRFPIMGESLAMLIGGLGQKPEENAEKFDGIFDQLDEIVPSQVRLNMETNLTVGENPNIEDATLNITIKGTGVKDAGKILDGAVLGLYITENGLNSKQVSSSGWLTSYDHENVLRVVGTENPWGDEIVWNGDNFEKTYEVTIPKKQYNYINNKNTLNAVAYVSLPYVIKGEDGKNYFNADKYNVWVNQCQFLHLPKGQATAIKGVETSENATVVARYAADGSQISAPVKGINILKMSDGTTRKVIVK